MLDFTNVSWKEEIIILIPALDANGSLTIGSIGSKDRL